MWDLVYYLFVLVMLAGAIIAGALLLRKYKDGTLSTAALFAPRPDPRLDVVESTNVDGKRRLVLIRRDDVEHLIMTGGPVDVVIETGIGEKKSRRTAEVVEGPTTVYSRPPRSLGQAAGEQ